MPATWPRSQARHESSSSSRCRLLSRRSCRLLLGATAEASDPTRGERPLRSAAASAAACLRALHSAPSTTTSTSPRRPRRRCPPSRSSATGGSSAGSRRPSFPKWCVSRPSARRSPLLLRPRRREQQFRAPPLPLLLLLLLLLPALSSFPPPLPLLPRGQGRTLTPRRGSRPCAAGRWCRCWPGCGRCP